MTASKRVRDPLKIPGVIGRQINTTARDQFLFEGIQKRRRDQAPPVMTPLGPGIGKKNGAFRDRIGWKPVNKRGMRFAVPKVNVE